MENLRFQGQNGFDSRQFVATSVYQATQARHLAVQLYHEHTNKSTNKREEDSLYLLYSKPTIICVANHMA